MERLKERIAIADKALTTFELLVQERTDTPVWRDACIKRFEYSFETAWKAAQRYLALQERSWRARSP